MPPSTRHDEGASAKRDTSSTAREIVVRPEGVSAIQYNLALIAVTLERTFGSFADLIPLLMVRAVAIAVAAVIFVAMPTADLDTVALILGGIGLIGFELFLRIWQPIDRRSVGDAVRWDVKYESELQRRHRHRVVALILIVWALFVGCCFAWVARRSW